MWKIKNGELDQYGARPFEQQQFGTAGVEGVNDAYIDSAAVHRLGCEDAVFRRQNVVAQWTVSARLAPRTTHHCCDCYCCCCLSCWWPFSVFTNNTTLHFTFCIQRFSWFAKCSFYLISIHGFGSVIHLARTTAVSAGSVNQTEYFIQG